MPGNAVGRPTQARAELDRTRDKSLDRGSDLRCRPIRLGVVDPHRTRSGQSLPDSSMDPVWAVGRGRTVLLLYHPSYSVDLFAAFTPSPIRLGVADRISNTVWAVTTGL
jgi:hypothetical protein